MSRAGTQLKAMPSMAERYFSIQSLTQREVLQNLLCNGIYEESIAIDFFDHFNQGIEFSKLDQLVRSDLAYYLPGDILTKVDMATMANSLELRSPMLDVNVVEWGVSLPDKYKIKGFETKHILKDVARSLVPAELIDRPKMGFGIPRAEWLRTGMKEMVIDTLTDNTSSQRGWFNPIEVKKTIDTHMSGENKDNQIWPMLMLELWARTWLD
jgi:asparagine synthase (glutamine-hydrolysing)